MAQNTGKNTTRNSGDQKSLHFAGASFLALSENYEQFRVPSRLRCESSGCKCKTVSGCVNPYRFYTLFARNAQRTFYLSVNWLRTQAAALRCEQFACQRRTSWCCCSNAARKNKNVHAGDALKILSTIVFLINFYHFHYFTSCLSGLYKR